jgi:hypothetical protein
MAKVQAIVRGPEDFFDGTALYPPGSVVEVDEQWVSDEDTIDDIVTVRLSQPLLDKDNKVVRTMEEVIKRRTMFRPLGNVDRATLAAGAGSAPVQPDRLNVTDMLKGSVSDIVARIESGGVDDFLDAIAMAESQGKARKGITDAVTARMNAA